MNFVSHLSQRTKHTTLSHDADAGLWRETVACYRNGVPTKRVREYYWTDADVAAHEAGAPGPPHVFGTAEEALDHAQEGHTT